MDPAYHTQGCTHRNFFAQVGKAVHNSMRYIKMALIFCCIFWGSGGLTTTSSSETSQPFWRSKPKVYQQIVNERKIVVSTSTQSLNHGDKEFFIKGAGHLRAPAEFTFEVVQQFHLMPQMSEVVREVKYYSDRHELYLHLAALGFHSHMWMKVEWRQVSPGVFVLRWKNIRGFMPGMVGELRIDSYSAETSEISIDAYYRGKELFLPRVFLGVGLEVVTEAMAKKIRSFVETRYKVK